MNVVLAACLAAVAASSAHGCYAGAPGPAYKAEYNAATNPDGGKPGKLPPGADPSNPDLVPEAAEPSDPVDEPPPSDDETSPSDQDDQSLQAGSKSKSKGKSMSAEDETSSKSKEPKEDPPPERDPLDYVCKMDNSGRGRHENNMAVYAEGIETEFSQDCCQICAETKGCEALNFQKPRGKQRMGMCFLKSVAGSVNGPADEGGYESALLVFDPLPPAEKAAALKAAAQD